MTRKANWDTRWEVQKQHIVWRETFYEVKFNVLQKAYAHFRMMFVNKDTIIGANCTLADHVDKHGTAKKFAEKIGDTSFGAKKKILEPLRDLKSVLSWTIRAPFIVLALVGLMLTEGCQYIVQRMPFKVD